MRLKARMYRVGTTLAAASYRDVIRHNASLPLIIENSVEEKSLL